MKIAAACEGKYVCKHFGHCENFMIFDIKDNKIIKSESIPNPGHRPGFLPNYLNDLGVKAVIAGGMGGGAIEIFNEKQIEVITGVKGDAEKAVYSYIAGELKSNNAVCENHMHSADCGGH